MKAYQKIQARLTPEEKEGMASLLARIKKKREQATGVNEPGTLLAKPELRDDEGQRTARE